MGAVLDLFLKEGEAYRTLKVPRDVVEDLLADRLCQPDVDRILRLAPELFKNVTGLKVDDFELLVSLGVFNSNLMNDAVFRFKRYEESSLSYTGIYKHKVEQVGGYDIVITAEEFNDRM